MLLVVDVGNTNITLGVFDEEKLISTFRLTTKISRTSDEFGLLITDLIKSKNIKVEDIEDVIISSVVPDIMHSFQSGVIKYLHKQPIVVGPGIKTGIKVLTANPREVGADRIVDAVAGYYIYGGPIIVIDYGTATTYDYITKDGEFTSGVTAPGIRISARALWEDAAKLPAIEIKKPEKILGRDTITSMQSGLLYGHIGETEYIIDKIIEETGVENMKVVATGGLGKIISESTDKIDIYDPNLTLQGLRLVYNKEKMKK
ncbi:type III pantothenate kinase [Lachnospiraceae bacterium RM5]|nr:type III pantothenate kinase [Lachnospiraceae bacterium RM5]